MNPDAELLRIRGEELAKVVQVLISHASYKGVYMKDCHDALKDWKEAVSIIEGGEDG